MAFFTPLKLILLYMFTTGPCILTTKDYTKKINECQRCKVVTDSFNQWLEKTSRGKHEGGDAAWEEAKLKTYARSEMRLVEIQENLCSELKKHQDDCYTLSGEAETLLEQWWFHEHQDSLDLYTWLCIENLQYCCPSGHYGELCAPCSHKNNNEICGGNGKCNGDGTRKGDGRCICKKGYTGSGCDECAVNYYTSNASCKPCHQACDGCNGEGERACIKCAAGWSMNSGICIDDNECSNLSICKSNEYCINKAGSYDCKLCDKTCKSCDGPGPSSCTSCFPNHLLWIGKCMNVEFQRSVLVNCSIRIALYFFSLLLAIFIFKKSKSLSGLAVLIISLLIYHFESNSEINLFDIVHNFNLV